MRLDFFTVDHLCAGVDFTPQRPIIDLSNVTFFNQFALVYLGMFLRHHNSRGKAFNVIPPKNHSARIYLARQNFWKRFNFNPHVIKEENLRRFTTSTSPNDIVDVEKRDGIAEDIAEEILKVLHRNGVNVKIGIIAEVLSELVDNFSRHSGHTLAAVVVQYYPNLKRVLLAIGDCGIGIRSSLSSNPSYKYLANGPHYEAALKAFESLVSRTPGYGTGLTEVREQVINLGGHLTLATGDGYVIINKEGVAKFGQMAYDLPGVQIQLSFPEEG